jgi:hypothetical protein
MPMKCIDQTPMPIATPPPPIHAARPRPCASCTREPRSSAVYDAITAVAIDTATSQPLYPCGDVGPW